MNERNTPHGSRLYRTLPVVTSTTRQQPRKFGMGWAIIAILAFLIMAIATTCSGTPDDYSRLRSHSAAITTTERTVTR